MDLWHVGHHGSHNATTPDLLTALTPQLAVISMGRWDDGKDTNSRFSTYAYGHPRKPTVDLLKGKITGNRSEGIQVMLGTGAKRFTPNIVKKRIYATGWDGTIKVQANLHREYTVTRNN